MHVHRRDFFASTAALAEGGIIAGGVRTAVAAEANASAGMFIHNATNHDHSKTRLTSPDDAVRQRALANLEHCLRVSAAAGGSGVLIVVGNAEDGPEGPERARDEIRKADAEGKWKGFVDITAGDIDWAGVRAALRDIGFTRWVSAEVDGGGRGRAEGCARPDEAGARRMGLRLDHATRALSAALLIAATVLISFAHRSSAAEPGDGLPPPKDAAAWTLSDQTYRVHHLLAAAIRVDGRTDEPSWSEAAVERRFQFPWRKEAAPPTEFRAVCDDQCLAFAFQAHDPDIVVLDTLGDEEDVVLEDRVEMFFAPDDRLRNYFCVEIDSQGKAYDYAGSYYRRFDPRWSFPGLQTAAAPIPGGYVVEGRIPLTSLEQLGFPRLRPGVTIRCGLYRAEFSHDTSGRPVEPKETIHNRGRKSVGPLPIEHWISWVDPQTPEPDFHVPSSLGRLEIVDELPVENEAREAR